MAAAADARCLRIDKEEDTLYNRFTNTRSTDDAPRRANPMRLLAGEYE
jgi:hypothetical protein